MKRRDLRVIIINALYQYQLLDTDPDELLDGVLKYDLPSHFAAIDQGADEAGELPTEYRFSDKEELDFVVRVVINAINNEEELEKTINSRLKGWSFDRLGYTEQAILLMALSELELKTAPSASIIDEAVDLAKSYCDDDAYKLINGVLDQ